MKLTNASSSSSLSARAELSRAGSSGAVTVGSAAQQVSFSDADQAYQVQALFADASTASLDLTTGIASGDAWVSPVKQVETTDAVGTITTAGSIIVGVSSADVPDGSISLGVPVAENDTPSTWAARVRAVLSSNTTIAGLFDVSGTGASITLTKRPSETYTMGAEVIEMAYADDPTLNISLENDTSVGAIDDLTSNPTTAGVAASGVYIVNSDVDFEGIALESPSSIYAISMEHSSSNPSGQVIDYTAGSEFSGRLASTPPKSSSALLIHPDPAILTSLSFLSAGNTGLIKATVIAKV